MAGLSEEASVGEHVPEVLAGRWGVLQEHPLVVCLITLVVCLITQPGEKRQGRIERSRSGISLAIIPQVAEGFVQYGQIAALNHRSKESGRSCSWRTPQREDRHGRNLPLNAAPSAR